jgi:hypothetical protein
MPNTYTLIASSTVSSPTYTVTFSSISQTYTDLKLVFSARSDNGSAGGQEVSIQLNSITSGYSSNMIFTNTGNTTSAASTTSNPFYTWGGGMVTNGSTSNTFSNSEIYIPNYTSSTGKPALTDSLTENNGTPVFTNLVAHLSTNTAAVTSITLYAWQSFINFVSGSTFYLYGIKKD